MTSRRASLAHAEALLADMERRDAEQGGYKDGKKPASRVCTKCRRVLPLGFFAPSARFRSGRLAKCRNCLREYERDLSKRHREESQPASSSASGEAGEP